LKKRSGQSKRRLLHMLWAWKTVSRDGLPKMPLRLIGLGFVLGAMLGGLQEAGSASHEEVLYAGKCAPECLRFIIRENSPSIATGAALKLTPDQWHAPVHRLNCAGKSRRDFTAYNTLEFYFRSPNPDPGTPRMHLRTWNRSSRVVSIQDYIEGGIIDNTFRRVTIPLSDLATEDWDLGNVESLVWNEDAERRNYYVADIVLRQTEPPALISSGTLGPFPESNRVLRLTLTKRCDEKTLRTTTNYSLVSPSDPSYANPVHPDTVGIHYRVYGFSPSAVPGVRFSVFIHLPAPLKTGETYKLLVSGIKDQFGNVMDPTELVFQYDETKLLNTNIKVNQEGYLPDGPKVGYVGGYLGDLGGAIWAAGDKGALVSWRDPNAPRTFDPIVTTNLRGVSGIREDDLYCVGDAGVMLHWNGRSWHRVEVPTRADLLAVHFSPEGVGWAVGAEGVTLRCDGDRWQLVPSGVQTTLRGIWSGPHGAAWAVGDRGTMLKWGGKDWIQESPITESDLHAINGAYEDQLWAVGGNGTVLLHRSNRWSVFHATPVSKSTLHCVTASLSGQVWVGGDGGVLWHKSGYGSLEFVAKPSGSRMAIYGLAEQDARNLWRGGAEGLILQTLDATEGWRPEKFSVGVPLRAVFALPYGALRLPIPLPSVIIRDVSQDRAVMTVPLRLEAANWGLSGEDVYSFDFSALTKPGTYRAFVPGLGLSDPFKIGTDVLDRAAYISAHAFYYQRCGIALTQPYAEERFSRPICHEHDPARRMIDAAYHTSLPKTSLFQGEKPGVFADAQGGWHDAGDYGKYIPTAAAAVWYLFTAFDMAPDKFPDGSWNIPESGNGVPDLLDESRWEVDWIVKVQQSDGGVHHKLTSQKWFNAMPQEERSPRLLFERTTHDTASATAVLASAARLWKPYDGKIADGYLRRALMGWNFLKQHPLPTPDGGFRNPSGNTTGEYRDAEDVDNRLWAAAELYRTTGEAEYRDYFESWWARNREHPWGWNEWQHFYRCAYWAYLMSPWPDSSYGIKREIQKSFLHRADEVLARTYANPYRNGARLDVPEWIGWGSFIQSTKYAFVLLQADYVDKTTKYRTAALLNLDAQLGANPLSFSFITGLGRRFPRDPLHLPSLYDGVEDPIPGLPIFGVAAHLPTRPPYYVAVQSDENSFPRSRDPQDPYPVLRRYVDAHELVPMSEFTIVDMAVCAATFHLLAPQSPRRAQD
jgi:photosystem II stability/assembly factor-like uncharacterized protein